MNRKEKKESKNIWIITIATITIVVVAIGIVSSLNINKAKKPIEIVSDIAESEDNSAEQVDNNEEQKNTNEEEVVENKEKEAKVEKIEKIEKEVKESKTNEVPITKVIAEENKTVNESKEVSPKVEEPKKEVKQYELKDAYFFTALEDIYINKRTYEGNRLTYEGFVYIEPSFNNQFFVTARKYYCCGTDSYVIGLESVFADSLKDQAFPQENEWIKVSGIINYKKDASEVDAPYIIIDKIEYPKERGLEMVNN